MNLTTRRPRCAIYSRKSSEEGLEQDFNSLHAQREACEAYIKSQAHEGWVLIPTVYDDGGYSGGTLERPALQQLLKDIRERSVQIIVVYKVDRLTRSLADFARIVEQLDQHGASFVSVTQQFNTTSSMGRLTLNVLLSFAQFEREVTGERIRDKIGASKRKGLWMGGTVPLGYAPKDRTLTIVPEDAKLVRHLYQRYVALRSVDALVAELKAKGTLTRRRTSSTGKTQGGCAFSRGALYHLLRNPLYLGEIRHKSATFPGQHKAIIDRGLWDRTQQLLLSGARRRRGTPGIDGDHALRGKLFDNAGHRMTPTYTVKRDGRRYRYYVSQAVLKRKATDGVQIPRMAADAIETLVQNAVDAQASGDSPTPIRRVVISRHEVRIELAVAEGVGTPASKQPVITVPVRLHRRGQEVEILRADTSAQAEPVQPGWKLLRAMIRAYQWRAKLDSGNYRSIDALSRAEHINATYVATLLPLAFLAPDLTDSILRGRQPARLGLERTRKSIIPVDWINQRNLFSKDLGWKRCTRLEV